MALEMTSELQNKLERLRNTCSYILPIDEETKQKEIDKAKNKKAVSENKSFDDKDKNVKTDIQNNEDLEDLEDEDIEEIIEDEFKDEVIKPKPARVNKKEVQDVKKHEHHVNIKEIRENKKQVADIDNEEEIEDEDFDEIESNFKKNEPKKHEEIKQVKNINKNDDVKKDYIEVIIEEKKQSKKIDLDISLDNKNKPNAAPKLSKNQKKNIDENLDVQGVKVVKQSKKQANIENVKENKIDKSEEINIKYKENQNLGQTEKFKSEIKNSIEKPITGKTVALPKQQMKTIRKVTTTPIKPIGKNIIQTAKQTKKTQYNEEDIVVRDKTLPKNQQLIKQNKNVNQTTKKIAKQPVGSSTKSKNAKIKSRKLNFDINKLEEAKERTRQSRNNNALLPKVRIPENYQGDAEFLKNIFNFDNVHSGDFTTDEERQNSFKVYSNPNKMTTIQKQVKPIQKDNIRQVNITPLQDKRIKELYYPTLKESYNVKDKEIERNLKQNVLEKQSISDENAYALFKQQEAAELASKTLQNPNNSFKIRDFKPRKK